MKKQLLQSAAAISFATVCSVLAVPSPAKAAPPVPYYVWTGFYGGVNGGYSWGQGAVVYSDPGFACCSGGLPGSISGSNRLNGGFGGFQGGYNWQFNNSWVGGIEADFQISSEKASSSFAFPFNDGESLLSGTLSSKINWFGTYRSRLGYLVNPNLLVFVTGGLAIGKVSVSGSLYQFGGDCEGACAWSFTQSAIKAGWAAGGGIEGMIPMTQKWSWKVEYLHIDLGTLSGTAYDPSFGNSYTYSARFTDDILRFGVNYHFP